MLLQIVQKIVKENNIKKVLLGFSGGVDSTVLAYLFSQIPDITVRAVYVNHGISDNAFEWQSFCEKFCQQYNIEFFARSVCCDTKNRESLEEVARNKRYSVYQDLIQDHEYLVLGHHSDDQVETVLLQLMRGTGLSGLSGMPVLSSFHNGFILRPLLDTSLETVTKQMIVDYAKEHNIQHIHDESNDSNEYKRNFLRNVIIPQLKEEFGNINKTISRTANNVAECEHFLQETTPYFTGTSIACSELNQMTDLQIKYTLKKWLKSNGSQNISSGKYTEIIDFIRSQKTDSKFKIENKSFIIQYKQKELHFIKK